MRKPPRESRTQAWRLPALQAGGTGEPQRVYRPAKRSWGVCRHGADLCLLPGRAAPGPSGPPTGDGAVQEPDLFSVELAAAVFVPLGVDPHPEAVFPFRGVVL